MKYIFLALCLAAGFFGPGEAPASDEQIEIFDIKKGKVVQTVPVNEEVRKEVEKMLEGVTGIYAEFNPVPDKGYMVKVPLDPPVRVQNKWLNDYAKEVIVIFPEYENPHLLVFDSRANSFFLTFHHDVDKFLKKIKYTPKRSGNRIFSKTIISS